MALTLPEKFTQRIQQQLQEEAIAFNNALLQPSPTSIRVNNKKFFQELALVPEHSLRSEWAMAYKIILFIY